MSEMSAPGNSDQLSQQPPTTANQLTFPAWAFSTLHRLYKFVGIGAILASAVAIGYLGPEKWVGMTSDEIGRHLESLRTQRANIAFIQAALCFVLALFTPKSNPAGLKFAPTVSDARRELATYACERIRINLIAVFMLWSVYYLVTGISLLQSHSLLDDVFLLTLSAVTTLQIYWLYIEMAEITHEESRASKPRTSSELNLHRAISLGVALLVIVPAWYGYGRQWVTLVGLIETAGSILAGVSMALVVGRLGSKHLNPGSVVIGLLYLYAVLQPAAAAFGDPAVHLLATTIALPLKVLLWLVCVWAFTTGILAEYMYEVRAIIEVMDARRDHAKEG